LTRTEGAPSGDAGAGRPAEVQPLPHGLRPPLPSLDLVVRDALLATLSASDARLVVVQAPAGWGKTTVLAQWTDSERRPRAWLQLEAAHNDPLVLLTSFAAALGGIAPVDPMVAQWTRRAAPPVRERILPSLEASLEKTSPFFFVLDDAQILTDKTSWGILDVLLRAFPPGARLAVATRTEPPLPLARLQAAGQLLQVSLEELALDARETAELLGLRGLDASAETAAALQATTEGWAAGISLAALACDRDSTADWLAGVRGDQRDIARYLTTEVLERQSRSVRAFLLQTSILERLSADLCRAVTGRDDAGRTLARLARDNVFLAALDEGGVWYRYHQLFAELLRSELERRDGARVPELHAAAAVWCEDHGQPEEAVRHWLAAGEVTRAATIVCRMYTVLSGQGQIQTIRRWLELFSDEQLLSSVPLTLTAGWVASMTGGSRAGRLWSSAALSERVDDSPMPDGAGSLRASQAALRAGVGADGVTRMREDAELAASLMADNHPTWRAGTGTMLGVSRWLSGDNAGAYAAFDKAVEDGDPLNVVAVVGALGYRSLVLADEGHWAEAQGFADMARQKFTESELALIGPTLIVPLAEGRALAYRGAPAVDAQVEAVQDALGRLGLPKWFALTAAVVLAEIALDRGDIPQVVRWTESGMMMLRSWPDAGILRGRLERLRRAVEELRLAGPLTPRERRALELLATHLTMPEIARDLSVSHNTLKTHVRDLFRKLEVHSRTEAVSRAREIGLLKG
jgi:LuxR family maltose regulon positive regulatory protein